MLGEAVVTLEAASERGMSFGVRGPSERLTCGLLFLGSGVVSFVLKLALDVVALDVVFELVGAGFVVPGLKGA